MSRTRDQQESTFAFAAMLCLYRNNDAQEVEEALHAAFDEQKLTPAELLVVFDGPVPSKVEAVIKKFEQSHAVRRIVHETCKGHGPARAAAINACRHDWVAIIDADDISMSNRFSDLAEAIKTYPETAVIGGGLVEFHTVNAKKIFGHAVSYPETPEQVRRYLTQRSPIAQPTSILRVAAIKAVGNYQDWFNNEDYHLWIRLVSAGYELRNLPQPILWFRTNPNLFARRGGVKYWWNEVRLQVFSYRHGTTTISRLVAGTVVRFFVQVVMPVRMREIFYKKILRNM